MEDLFQLCGQAQELAKEGARVERGWIKDIMEKGYESSHQIEGILDRLLDYVLWGHGDKEFHELNGYYRTFCPEGADFYLRLYREVK